MRNNIIFVNDYHMGIFVYNDIEYILSPQYTTKMTHEEQLEFLKEHLGIEDMQTDINYAGACDPVKKQLFIRPKD